MPKTFPSLETKSLFAFFLFFMIANKSLAAFNHSFFDSDEPKALSFYENDSTNADPLQTSDQIEADIVKAISERAIPSSNNESSANQADSGLQKKIMSQLITEMQNQITEMDQMQTDAASLYPNVDSYLMDSNSVVNAIGSKKDLADKIKQLAIEQNNLEAIHTAYKWVCFLKSDSQKLLKTIEP